MAKEKVETKKSKIINAVIMTIEVIVIIFGIIFSIMMITGQKTTTDELGSGTNITAVLSDSMDGSIKDAKIKSFKIGDLLLIKNIATNEEAKGALEVGDVITYLGVGPTGEYGLISHRIIKITKETIADVEVITYHTLGDKQYTGNEEIDEFNSKPILARDVQGVVTGQIGKVGYAIIWLQDSTHFLLVVVLPLAALLIYNVYLFIRMILEYKIKKIKEQNELAVQAIKAEAPAIDEEEIKRKAIEEYIKAQNEAKAEDKVEDTKVEPMVQEEEPKQ